MAIYVGNVVYEDNSDTAIIAVALTPDQEEEVAKAIDKALPAWVNAADLSFDLFDQPQVEPPFQVDRIVTWYFD